MMRPRLHAEAERLGSSRQRWNERGFSLRGYNDPRFFLLWNETQDRRIRNRDPETHARCKQSRADRLAVVRVIRERAMKELTQ